NIAHGCNSVAATRTALKLADYVVTEAGFGADLGAEKFFDIKCRKAGLKPAAAIVVATIRALKFHGGIPRDKLSVPDVTAVQGGLANLGRHIDNVRRFGIPAIVAVNAFSSDTEAEMDAVRTYCAERGVPFSVCTHWADGGAGTVDLAELVVAAAGSGEADFAPLYPDSLPLFEKIRRIAREIYGAADATAPASVLEQLRRFEAEGHGDVPVCMAKTQYSFSTDPALKGA